MKSSKFLAIIFSLAIAISGVSYSAYAADSWSEGGSDLSGDSGGGSGNPSVDCTSMTNERCNVWILVSSSQFKTAWNNRVGSSYSQSAYDTCTDSAKNKSGQVIMAGQRVGKKSGGLTLWNLYPKPGFFGQNYKVYYHHQYSYNYGTGQYGDIFALSVPNDDKNRTNQDLLDSILSNMTGSDKEARLAFFCAGLVDEIEEDPCTDDPCSCPNPPAYCNQQEDVCPFSAPTSYSSSSIDSGTSVTNSASRNRTTGTGWKEWVYAKPTDKADYTHCLFPGAQAVRHSTSHGEEGMGIQNTANGPQNEITATSNDMTVQRFNLWGNQTFSYTLGSTAIKNETSNVYTVTRDDEGKDLTQTSSASIGSADSGNEGKHRWLYYEKWVPAPCTGPDGTVIPGDCGHWDRRYSSHSNNYYSGNVGGSSSGVTAHVYVPYNFTTDVRIDSIGNNPVYSGERTTVNYHVNINTRENTTTGGTRSKQYATKTPSDTLVQLVSFYYDEDKSADAYLVTGAITSSDPCSFYGAKGGKNCKQIDYSGSLSTNTGSNGLGVSTRHDYSDPVSVYDAPAGSKFCVAVGINHADSGDDTNDKGAGTVNNNWNISNASCRTIVKKPNMQVWGASIYTTGNITTSASKKTYYDNSNSIRSFSSWVEYGIITNGKVRFDNNFGLTSGASTGYQFAYTGTPITGGLTQNLGDNCYRSPLTISNRDCNNIGQSGITLNTTFLERLKSRFFVEENDDYKFGGDNLNLLTSHKELTGGTGYRYTRVNGIANITSAPILTNGATHIVYATEDININTNLLYADSPVVNNLLGTGYSSISQVPQYIIYSESGSINISKDVTHIDAWLIAPKGTVNTCPDFVIGTSNMNECQNQLVVNGPVIAENLVLNRTYGGDNGVASATPAEIFNLTPATYLWAYSQARNYPQAFTTYMRQLAPRY